MNEDAETLAERFADALASKRADDEPLPSEWFAARVIAEEVAPLLAKSRADAAEKAWDDGYNDAATMAHCYGHTDHWPEEDEPRNPYRAAVASHQEGGA